MNRVEKAAAVQISPSEGLQPLERVESTSPVLTATVITATAIGVTITGSGMEAGYVSADSADTADGAGLGGMSATDLLRARQSAMTR